MNPKNLLGAVNQAVGTTFSAVGKVSPYISMAYAGYQVFSAVQPMVSNYWARNEANRGADNIDHDDEDEIVELVVSPRRVPRRVYRNSTPPSPGNQQVEGEATESRSQQAVPESSRQQTMGNDDSEVEVVEEVSLDRKENNVNNDVEIVKEIPGTREIDAMFQARLSQDQEPVAGPSRLFDYVPNTVPGKRIVFVDELEEDNDEQTNRTYPKLPIDPSHTGEGGLDLDSDLLCQICGRYLHHADKELSALPFCDHLFHEKCIQGVMAFNQKCPKCASSIFTPI